MPSNGNNRSCPTGAECDTISHYANISRYVHFPSKVTFLFLEGLHELNANLVLNIPNVSLQSHNLSSAAETTILCKCSEYQISLRSRVKSTLINGLTVSNCSYENKYASSAVKITQSTFHESTLQINTGDNVVIHASHFKNCELTFSLCTSTNIISSHFANSEIKHFSSYATSITFVDSTFDNSPVLATLFSFVYDVFKIVNSKMYNYHDHDRPEEAALVIYCYGAGLAKYPVHLSNVTISNNSKTGMLIHGLCDVMFQSPMSVFVNNHSPDYGGGIRIGTQPTIGCNNTEVSFINNTAKLSGGAIYIDKPELTLNVDIEDGQKPYCALNQLRLTFSNNLHQ
jgi:predicted outer membrane repeat protein